MHLAALMMDILINILLIMLIAFTGFYVAVLLFGLWDWFGTPRLNDQRSDALKSLSLENETLDIVVPARNEGGKIERCLESLRAQTFARINVWMVNDRSTDDTEDIMRRYADSDARFHMLQGIDPPQGWVGKVNALMQAYPHLSASWVLFLDADTQLHPETLERSLKRAIGDDIEMLTLIPFLECESFWERVILPAVIFLIGLRYPSRIVNSDRFPNIAIANGQYILIQREVYERIGTHRAIAHSIVEDLDLAKRAKKMGVRLRIVLGLAYFRVRMYTSFADLREGWTKNMHFGDPDFNEVQAVLQVLNLWLLGTMPFLGLILGYGVFYSISIITLSWMALAIMLITMTINRFVFKVHPLYAVFHPLAMVIVGWFLWESRRLALSETGVTWKGRQYKAQ